MLTEVQIEQSHDDGSVLILEGRQKDGVNRTGPSCKGLSKVDNSSSSSSSSKRYPSADAFSRLADVRPVMHRLSKCNAPIAGVVLKHEDWGSEVQTAMNG